MEEVNLRAMMSLKNAFNLEVGYSDHSVGNTVSIAAVALGAKVIEKHFTIDKQMIGPDHLASLDPTELKKFIKDINDTVVALETV